MRLRHAAHAHPYLLRRACLVGAVFCLLASCAERLWSYPQPEDAHAAFVRIYQRKGYGQWLVRQFRQLASRGHYTAHIPRRAGLWETPADWYAQLGIQEGADVSEVKRAFRSLARKYHPDVCSQEDLIETGERFAEVKSAYDAIMAAAGQAPLRFTAGMDLGRDMSGFKRNMATGRGHHRISDGRLYELWLDLRGRPCQVDGAQQVAFKLFWGMRNIVDELGVSLLKEGVIGRVLVDAADGVNNRTWDYSWVPLMVVDGKSGKVQEGKTGASAGWLHAAAEGRLLGSDEGGQVEQDFESRDLIVSAGNAWEAHRAQMRYSFVMGALALPPDPASWAVAASEGADAGVAAEIAQRLDRQK